MDRSSWYILSQMHMNFKNFLWAREYLNFRIQRLSFIFCYIKNSKIQLDSCLKPRSRTTKDD